MCQTCGLFVHAVHAKAAETLTSEGGTSPALHVASATPALCKHPVATLASCTYLSTSSCFLPLGYHLCFSSSCHLSMASCFLLFESYGTSPPYRGLLWPLDLQSPSSPLFSNLLLYFHFHNINHGLKLNYLYVCLLVYGLTILPDGKMMRNPWIFLFLKHWPTGFSHSLEGQAARVLLFPGFNKDAQAQRVRLMYSRSCSQSVAEVTLLPVGSSGTSVTAPSSAPRRARSKWQVIISNITLGF